MAGSPGVLTPRCPATNESQRLIAALLLLVVKHIDRPNPRPKQQQQQQASIPSVPISFLFAPVTMDLSWQPRTGAAQRRKQ